MTLRHKFGFLALIYVMSLIVNVVLCAWCILAYHQVTLESLSGTQIEPYLAESAGREEPAATESSDGATLVQEMTQQHERDILQILLLNTLCGLALSLLGLRFVRRWVSRPIAALREAAVEIGQGNFSHRVPVVARDELGLLAGEINNMAATVISMRDRLIEQERRVIAAQALRCVVHNIRSPLTGVRWLAEAIAMRQDVDARSRDNQNRIVQIVDDILTWLQGFRDSLAAASLQVKPVSIVAVFQRLADSVAHLAKTRDIVIEWDSSVAYDICIDTEQTWPALETLLRCAVTSCTCGQKVRLLAEREDCPQKLWRLIISFSDRGPRQPDTVRSAVRADPSQTPQIARGDLKMAERAIRMQGGHLEVRTDPSRCRFVVTFPDRCGADQHG